MPRISAGDQYRSRWRAISVPYALPSAGGPASGMAARGRGGAQLRPSNDAQRATVKSNFWTYLKAAFNARPFGMFVAPNWIGLAAIGLLGLTNPGFWLVGAGVELAYLLGLATNPRFQRAIAARASAGTAQNGKPGLMDGESSLRHRPGPLRRIPVALPRHSRPILSAGIPRARRSMYRART